MKSRIFLVILTLWFLSACNGTLQVGIEHAPIDSASTTMTEPAIELPGPTATTIPASPTVNLPSSTVASPTIQALTQSMVQIFLIAVDDNGQTGTPVGCGDSVVPVQVEIPPTQSVLKAALGVLLSVKDQYYGQSGLYNALYQSDLQVDSISIDGGKASVYLTGTLLMGGECDTPRVQAQLEQTVLQFPTVTEAAIFINGKPLADVLSLKGTDSQTSLTTQTPTQSMVQIFLIALEDNGQTGTQVGCGDSAVPVRVEIPSTQSVLKAALESLLSVKTQYYGGSGLYNALYQSDLQVDSVKIENGKATVYLTGTLQLGGECDSPRVQAQLEGTVLQFPTVNEASIFINGKPLSEMLSLKG